LEGLIIFGKNTNLGWKPSNRQIFGLPNKEGIFLGKRVKGKGVAPIQAIIWGVRGGGLLTT